MVSKLLDNHIFQCFKRFCLLVNKFSPYNEFKKTKLRGYVRRKTLLEMARICKSMLGNQRVTGSKQFA